MLLLKKKLWIAFMILFKIVLVEILHLSINFQFIDKDVQHTNRNHNFSNKNNRQFKTMNKINL